MRLLVPILSIAVGVGLLLTNLGLMPGVDWLWPSCLAAIGIATFALSGVDRFSVVVGPFFIAAALLSGLRQVGQIKLEIELPILFIIFGVLWAIAVTAPLSTPKWFHAAKHR